MPWVNEDLCVSCGVCVDDCPVGAITLKENQKAVINDDVCIRCGRCHEICPEEAVRHDGERIPEEVAANTEKTINLLKHYNDPGGATGNSSERMIRYCNKEQKVASLTIEELITMKEELL